MLNNKNKYVVIPSLKMYHAVQPNPHEERRRAMQEIVITALLNHESKSKFQLALQLRREYQTEVAARAHYTRLAMRLTVSADLETHHCNP
jgi:hypothetical protein